MRLVLDACVLFPTTVRGLLLGLAEEHLIIPLWSPRILEEWRRAEARKGGDAGIEIALMRDRFRDASISPDPLDVTLPDMADVHVLEAAVTGAADGIVTFNTKDFPTRALGRFGVLRLHPDAVLLSALTEESDTVRAIAQREHATAQRAFGRDVASRALFKKCGLPRFGKALEIAG